MYWIGPLMTSDFLIISLHFMFKVFAELVDVKTISSNRFPVSFDCIHYDVCMEFTTFTVVLNSYY